MVSHQNEVKEVTTQSVTFS